MSESEVSAQVAGERGRIAAPGKRLKRVRKVREEAMQVISGNSRSLIKSPAYLFLLFLRLVLIISPAFIEPSEHMDGVDLLAVRLLPGVSASDRAILTPPDGMGTENRTRSIVGAFITSGIPYIATNIVCNKYIACPENIIGYVAVYLPRLWMFLLSIIGDFLLLKVFSRHMQEDGISAVITYASTWTSLIGITRNSNFALESLCLIGILAGCFGWGPNSPRPLFWLSATALALGTWLRPVFFAFISTPLIYLSSLWGKSGVSALKYIRAALEGIAIFAFWATLWVTVDSVFYGTFKLRFGDAEVESFVQFMEYLSSGLPFSYKGSLVYVPINALQTILNRKFVRTLAQNTTPGQMFLSLPGILGPLFIVLLQESYKSMKVAVKELMTEIKAATNSTTKKTKKRKGKKGNITKEEEEELLVFIDTIQTTLLLGLLLEVLQNHDRLGTMSLLSLIPPAIMCMPAGVFGPKSSSRFRVLHIIFTIGMVLFYGFLNQSGVQRTMLTVGRGGVEAIPENANLVMFKSTVGNRAALGPNAKNVSVYAGGDTTLNLMTTLRELKARDDYHEDRLLVCAAGTVKMKDSDFTHVAQLASAHMTLNHMPENIDQALKKSTLNIYKFVGDEDEAIIRDDEEAADEEEREKEQKEKEKQKSKKEEL